ncbi:hypothetical protein HZH68_015707 [Vespula germanica]|uniref:PiggyBac transposable element-derived protein domain-containing protein n=1 Tax=Vespula germanica TaxID=30212 RepID=A0A834J4X6_VESGE|nr:hypothetical protein HZH68_015707 [Vespula germanica]
MSGRYKYKDFDSSDSDEYMQNTINLRFNIIEEEDVTNYLTNDMARVNISEDSDTDFEIYFRHRNVRPRVPSSCTIPIEYFKLFFTEELIKEIVDETNAYAAKIISGRAIRPILLSNDWKDIIEAEMNKFLGVIINIGLVILPDKRIITILSTKLRSTSHNVSRSARYSNNIRRIEQPEMIIYYKQNMVDVNVANQSGTSEKQSLDGKSHFIFVHSEGKQKDCAVCSSRKISGGRRETNFFFVKRVKENQDCTLDIVSRDNIHLKITKCNNSTKKTDI